MKPISTSWDSKRPADPIAEFRGAFKDPLAGLLGACIGGWVPLATSIEAHSELFPRGVTLDNIAKPSAFLVLGGLVYSAKTVWQWGRAAFNDPLKATGFVLLLEGVMVFSSERWLSTSALVYLVTINAIATASRLGFRESGSSGGVAPAMEAVVSSTSLAVPPQALPRACRGQTLRRPRVAVTLGLRESDSEAKYRQALEYVTATRRCSKSELKRQLKIGWTTADAIVKRLEEEGAVTTADKDGSREVAAGMLSAHARAV